MQTKRITKKISLAALLFLCLAALALAVLGGGALSRAQAADNGSIIDYNVTPDSYIRLDVNGGVSTNESLDLTEPANTNSDPNAVQKTRTIAIKNLISQDKSAFVLKKESDNPQDALVYNYSDEYFTITPTQSTNNTWENIEITAKASTNGYVGGVNNRPRFAMILSDDQTTYTAIVEVSVTASIGNIPNNSTIYVGEQLNIDVQDESKYAPLPLALTNYSKVEVDLGKYLSGRKIFLADPKTSDHKVEPDKENEFKVQKTTTGEYVTFNDISELNITGKPYVNDQINTSEMYYTGAGQRNTAFIFTVEISSALKDKLYLDATQGKFWENEGVYFELTVLVEHRRNMAESADKTFTVKIPVVFRPSKMPQMRSEYKMDRYLNAGSSETSIEGGTSLAGYKTVRIYPEYLCDFPAYDKETMLFVDDLPEVDSTSVVEVRRGSETVTDADGTESEKVYYEVTGVNNGTAVVTFQVYYYLNTQLRNPNPVRERDVVVERQSPVSVAVTFSVYGNYSVTLTLKGTKTHKFSIDSKAFQTLYDDGYQITDMEVTGGEGVNAADYVAPTYNGDGTFSLRPVHNASSGTVAARVTMVNMQGRKIVLDCPIVIDMKAGDFFATWRTWQIILFWVGIGLAAALLILLIVWLFIRSVHKNKIDELETTAPTSAYIIKLNSTIAAAQAQQRLATQGYAGPQPSQMLQLGAGPASTPAPDPNTLALGVTPQTQAPMYSAGAPTMSYGYTTTMAPPPPQNQTTNVFVNNEEIYIPLSDEELLLRIYEEKFEPRGMLKRTFDKSKDLQQRELEREKERIREDVRNGMSIEEACKSLKQREAEAAGIVPSTGPLNSQPAPQIDPLIAVLGFDPSDPVIADVKREEPQDDWTDEIKKLKEAEYNNQRLRAELAIIDSRIEAITAATGKTETEIADANALIEELAQGIKESEQKLDDKNTDMAVERRKSAKEAIGKEIAELEEKIQSDKDAVSGKRSEAEAGNGLLVRIKEVSEEYADKKEATEALVATSDLELEAARADAQRAADLAEKARKQAMLNEQLETLDPMMLKVNTLDGEIKELVAAIEEAARDKDSAKTRVAMLQNELLSTTDSSKITELSGVIKDINKEISDLDRGVTANTTLKTNKGIEMSSVRRKANEFIDKEQIELEDVIAAEDKIIGKIAHEKLMKATEDEKATAEEQVAHWQGMCDSLVNNLDVMVMEAVADVANRVQTAEEALAAAQAKLAETDAAIQATEDDDAKLNLTMEQMTQQEEVKRLEEELEMVRAEGIKANLECRTKGEAEIENARAELAAATDAFNRVTERFHEVSTSIDPLDLIQSGSGVISQDRKKIESENLKKILEQQKKATEEARLQAQLAQEEADRAVADAQRASEESRAEAERLAQEALEKAEEARKEAERKTQEEADKMREEAERLRQEAQEEIERVRQEAEEARRLAEEEAERARLEAQEEAERARQEAEEARRLAEEEAEKARLEAQEEAERARLEAQEEAERARKEAEEEAERARKEAEEEAERLRLENEESKRLAEEEAEKARKEAEEEAKRQAEEAAKLSEEEAKRKARIEEKVAKRKAEIANLRAELKNVTEEEQGNALREKFYAIQLALDEDEKTSTELSDLLTKSMDDASHAAELSRYKKLANQKPRRIVKKVTERVNRVPRKKAGTRPGARPASARPGARPAARPGTRPAARPGARPAARPGTRPGARPAPRPGTRPTRPTGKGPTRK